MENVKPETETLTVFMFTTLIVLMLILNQTFMVLTSYASPTVKTEKSVYGEGEALSVSGTATPNIDVTIQLFDPLGRRKAIAQAEVSKEGLWRKAGIYTFTREDLSGRWIVKVYDTVLEEWAETSFMVDVTPPTIKVFLEPEKKVYGNETITIVVSSNEELKTAPTVTVTQAGASSVTVTMTETAPLKWSGTYTIVKGFDGTATVEATGEDLAGNIGTAKATFTVEVVPAWEKSIAELQKKISALETKISSLESKVTTLESKIKSLENKLTATSGEIGTLKSKVDSLSAEVATLSGISTIAYLSLIHI